MAVHSEVEVEATPQEVWDALVTEEGRERWLEEDRQIEVVHAEEPKRLVWTWSQEGEPPTRVEFLIVAAPAGTRVVVSETVPSFPIAMLVECFTAVAA